MAKADEPDYADELARIDASIADLKIRDMQAAKERTQIASKIQAAQFQRDILAHAQKSKGSKSRRVRRQPQGDDFPPPPPPTGRQPEREAEREAETQPARGESFRRRPAEGPPDWAEPGSAYSGSPGVATDGVTLLVDDPPPTERVVPPPAPRRPPLATMEHPPEASSQSVQNILLGLGALLLGVAAVVFAGVAVSNPFARALILALATGIALTVAPGVARRGLTSTGETIAAVGLILLPMTLYALHGSALTGGPDVPVALYLGLTFALTAVASFVYAGVTRLAAPRYATVIATQPVAPLLAYPLIQSPAGWGLALTTVAVLDLLLLTTVIRSGRLVPRWPLGRPVAADRVSLAEADDDAERFARREGAPDPADPSAYAADAPPRPESRPEEPDLIIPGLTRPRRRWIPTRIFPGPRPEGAPPAGSVPLAPPATPPSADWLRELTFFLLCVACAGALIYSSVALLQAQVVGDALRSGLILVAAAATAVAAARLLRHPLALNVAGAVLTLAVIGATARVADVVDPRWTLVAAAATVALTGAIVGLLAEPIRRGPQYASAGALTLIGLIVAVDALRAAIAPVAAARPIWNADTAAYAQKLAESVSPAGWLLAFCALLLTIAAALALPVGIRHEGAVAGIALTALSVPASLSLPWSEAPWPLVLASIGLGAAGLWAGTHRIAITHVVAAGVVGLFGAGAALSASWLTAAVLTAIAGAGVMVAIAARQIPVRLFAWLVGDWASGAAALALPGAAVTAALAISDTGGGPPPTAGATVPALAAGFLAVAGTLSYAAVFQVARREISLPLTVGTGLGALAMAFAALFAPGATAPDLWVGALLLGAAGLLFFAKSIDARGRNDRMLDGPDIAAAAATVAICGALARVAALAFPNAPLAVAGVVVLLVGMGVTVLMDDWRRGPARGLAIAALVVGAIAGWQALVGGLRILSAPGPLWGADLSQYAADPPPGAWQAPFALVMIAITAAIAMPKPHASYASGLAAALATIGAPWAFGLPWWSPLVVGGAVAIAYALAAVAAVQPSPARARAAVAAVVLLHATATGLAQPWSTALALLLVVLLGSLVAVMARVAPRPVAATPDEPVPTVEFVQMEPGQPAVLVLPPHRAQIGGAATGSILLALPGVFAAVAADQGHGIQVVLTAALAGSSLGLALLAAFGRHLAQYLPWATIGLMLGATITALTSLPTDYSTALYAAAAALLGVMAELLRGAVPAPIERVAPIEFPPSSRFTRVRRGAFRSSGLTGAWGERWLADPATGAVALALIPTVLALFSLAPALRAALIDPLMQLRAIWEGPIPELVTPDAGNVDATGALAALLLTGAAALAAIGFGGKASEAVPVVLPGIALTLLITPIALHASFPAATGSALLVFTISMLGLALTPPPVVTRAPLLRTTRNVVFAVGLLAGGAGLAGSLAEQPLTLFTLGSAVGVGLVAAIAGRTQMARILGWLFTAFMGQMFVMTGAIAAGLERHWAAFGVLAVGAALLSLEAALPRLGLPQYRAEAVTVEWCGYASALIAGVLAFDSLPHLAALLAAWGAVLGLTASRPDRTPSQRRTLFWLAVGFEILGWWLFIALAEVGLPEAYTLPFAVLALAVGVVEAHHRPDLSSWAAYGPALLAAFVPTAGIVLAGNGGDVRVVLLLLGAVITLIIGSRSRQQAPVVVGTIATVIAAFRFAFTLGGPWLMLVPIGVVLLFLGATSESRRRAQELRNVVSRMR
ncbi:SCO7613 C-terminal domain-containing membrane protein [Actinoplanes sp. GCM10030250]|uniref:SCO7613 C-terminal domain-containing membrane protein n=1 Tax=Actinoplanes sp. GCM10030250 TaxID=3273376 RepID=UPI0036060D14